ncbi:hypothetical protein CR513_50245, partial [Mucuna pruriens]
MKAFPFSLDGAAKDWLYLQPALLNTWGDMKRTLEKFFPASKIMTIWKEICGIRQHVEETLHEYWERFNRLCATCQHHHISEQLLIQYFYKGLMMMDRSMIDAASGGALMDKTPAAERHLISDMASNTQQFGIRGVVTSRVVNKVGAVDNLRLENQLTKLTSLVRQLAVSQHQQIPPVKIYGICTFLEHPTDLSSTNPLYELDLEIEITLHRLRKVRNIVVSNSNSSDSVSSSDNSSPVTNTSDSVEYSSINNFSKPEQMENNDRTLKELATLDVVYQPWCIQYPQLEPAQSYELKSGFMHLFPKLYGLAGEDPRKHLKEFHVVCSIMRPQGILEEYIKMKVFPFSLDRAAKDWLYLQPALFNTWGDMKHMFLEKFFSASRAATIRKEICGIRQHSGETLHEY